MPAQLGIRVGDQLRNVPHAPHDRTQYPTVVGRPFPEELFEQEAGRSFAISESNDGELSGPRHR